MGGKRRANPVADEQIVAHYRTTHSAYKTAAALGLASSTVERVLTKFQEPRPGLAEYRSKITKFRGQETAIRADYEGGATYDQLRQRFGQASNYALKHAIRRAGGQLRQNPAPVTKDGELEKLREMSAAGQSQMIISLRLGRSQSFVSRLMRKHGIAPQKRRGPDHGRWKGGRWTNGDGYMRVHVEADSPLAAMRDRTGYVLEHRLVMASKLGRVLSRSETVHHKDGDRTNNDPDNLQLRQGKHGKGVVMCCLDCGSRNIGSVSLT